MESFIFVLVILSIITALTFVSWFLSRKNPKFIFIAPGVLTVISLIFIFLTYTNESWVALGYFIFAFTGSVASIILWIVTVIMFLRTKRR